MVDETITETVPEIYEVYPYLHVRGGAAAIDFYKHVFGAQEVTRLAYPDGRILGRQTESVSPEEVKQRWEAEFKPD